MEGKDSTNEFIEEESGNSTMKTSVDTKEAEADSGETIEEQKAKFPPPEVWPEKNLKPKKHSKMKLTSILNLHVLCGVFKKMCLIFLGYYFACMDWSAMMSILPITVITLIWYESKLSKSKNKIKSRAKASSSTKEQLLEKLDELPSWVLFPDRERAEWVNEIVLQLWPNINCFLVKFARGKLESKIRKKYDTFKFEEMDFGKTPPKIDGVKVYNRASTRDSVLIDFDVFYDGDCEINFSLSGHQVGRLKDFQLSVQVRVVLRPLMLKAPIVGGVQIFFLNTPEIDFELEGLTGIPGLSHVLRKQLEDKLRKKIVFPNKITKRFTKTVQATELKSLEPEGVLRIHIAEGRDLERRDVTGKSDPYVVLSVGAQEYKTAIIKRSLNPKWDEWCEFVILDPMAQQVKFKVFDHDLNEDDFLGSGVVDIKPIYDGSIDQWIYLDGVKHGVVHLRFTWMSLTSDYTTLDKALRETKLLKVDVSSSLLTIYVDSARNIPRVKSFKKPDPYLLMQVNNSEQQKSKVKKHTTDPIYEQGFSFLVKNPEEDVFHITIMDKQTNTKIDFFEYEVKKLISERYLEFSMREFPLTSGGPNTVIIVSMQLRVLTSESFSNEDSSSESASDFDLSRNDSTKLHDSNNHSPVPQTPKEVDEVSVTPDNVQKLNSSPLKSPKFKRLNLLNHRHSSTDHEGETHLGRLHVGLEYSERRQKLLVTVFSVANLPVRDSKDIPDPYVKLKLFSPTATVRHKTRTVMDDPNAEFKETFEYLLSPFELLDQKLLFTIKTKKRLFANNMFGQVLIDFKDLQHLELNDHHNKWYDILPEIYPE